MIKGYWLVSNICGDEDISWYRTFKQLIQDVEQDKKSDYLEYLYVIKGTSVDMKQKDFSRRLKQWEKEDEK